MIASGSGQQFQKNNPAKWSLVLIAGSYCVAGLLFTSQAWTGSVMDLLAVRVLIVALWAACLIAGIVQAVRAFRIKRTWPAVAAILLAFPELGFLALLVAVGLAWN